MRGFPFFNLLICLLVSGALVLPLVLRATHIEPRKQETTVQPPTQAPGLRALVRIKCVHAPQKATLTAAGRTLLEWNNPSGELTREESLELPADGRRVEFSFTARWPDGTPDTVAEISVEPDGLPAQTLNIWSTGPEAEDIKSLTWEGQP